MFKHILMPTDGTEHSERAVERGIELAKLCGARVTGIHVMPDYRMLIASGDMESPGVDENMDEQARAGRALSRFCSKDCGRGRRAVRHIDRERSASLRRYRGYRQRARL